MSYLLLENGRILNKDGIVISKGYVIVFDTRNPDGHCAFTKIKIIYDDESLTTVKQKLIEYCNKKSKAEIAFWVQELQRQVVWNPPKGKLSISKQVTKNHLIVQLVNLNDIYLRGEII